MSPVTEGAKLYTGAILSVGPDKVVPSEYAELVVSKNKSAFGVAVLIPENNEVVMAHDARGPDIVYFEATRNAYPGMAINFFLGNSNKGAAFKESDLQPFRLLTIGKTSDGKDKPVVAVMVDGDFPKYIKDNGHSEHYNYVHDYLRPWVEKINVVVEGNLDKMAVMLDDQNLLADCPTAMVTVFLGNGKIVRLLKNYETFKETSFGFVSDTYGWKEEAATAPSDGSLMDKLRGSIPKAGPVAGSVPPPPKAATAIPQKVLGVAYVLLKCPKELKEKAKIGAWYASMTVDGTVPDKHWERPEAKCKVPKDSGREPTKYKSFQEMSTDLEAKAKAAPVATADEPANVTHSTEPVQAPDPEVRTDDGDASNGDYELPVVTPEEREPLVAAVKTFQDENKNYCQDPKSMKEWTDKRETFREAAGLEKQEAAGILVPPEFSPEFLENMLATESLQVAFLTLFHDWQLTAKLALARIDELEKFIAELDKATEPAQKPQPQAGVVPPPPSTGSRLRKSVAA